ncbi:MAG: ABC transporter permease [Alphaproteobacteria bacterium]|nr:ABC transporter permease [Alphaproteobacteria bacterium]
MWRRILALIRKELLAILRDPRGRMVLIAPPIAQLVIFSFAATLEVTNADIAVLNQDSGRWSAEFLQRLGVGKSFDEVIVVRTPGAVRALIDARRVLAAVEIGPSFSRDLEAGRGATILIIADGRRSNAAQIAVGYLSQIAGTLGAEIAQASPERAAAPPAARIAATNWFNPNLNYRWFTVPSLVAVIALLVGLVVTALSVARERELGTFDQLMVSPLTPFEIMIGKTVPPLLIGHVHATIYILVAVFLFGVPFRGSLALLYLGLCLFLVAVIGVGLFLSAISQTQQQAILGAFLFMAPAIILSGFATPIENMPEWLQTLTYINPLRHFLVIVRGSFLKALPIAEVLVHLGMMAVIAAVTLGAATVLFRKRLE